MWDFKESIVSLFVTVLGITVAKVICGISDKSHTFIGLGIYAYLCMTFKL